jgi:rhomboid protease GluP
MLIFGQGGGGASGGLFGLIGATVAFGVRTPTRFGGAVKAQAIQWAVYGLVMSFMLKGSNTAHIGGAIAGFLVGLAVGPDEPTRERDRLVQGVLAWCCIAIVVVSLLLMALDVPHVPIRWE